MRQSAFADAPLAHDPETAPPQAAVLLDFAPTVPMVEVAGTLELALLATESLHGTERVQLDATWDLDWEDRTVRIETATRSGTTLALLFLGIARREFGGHAVRVQRMRPSLGQIAGAA